MQFAALTRLLKLFAYVGAFILTLLGIKHYGNLREDKGVNKGVNEATEVNDENYKELADDVLDGGHPYGVRNPNATEVSYPESDSGVRVASDSQSAGKTGGSRGNGIKTK
jgi:hypothetical protein